jgi:MFS family permease
MFPALRAADLPLAVAIDPHPVVLFVLVTLFGVGKGPLNPVLGAVKDDRVQVPLRGRVLAALNTLAAVAMPLGTVLAGLLLDDVGPTGAVLAEGAVFLAITLGPLLFPVWRGLDAGSSPKPGRTRPVLGCAGGGSG